MPLYAASVATTSSAVVVAILIINKNIDNVVVFITKQQITFKKHTYFVWVYVCTQQKLQQLLSLSRKQSKRLRNTNFCMLKFFLEIQAASMQTKIKTKREEATNFGSTFNFFLALFSYRHVCLVNSDKEIFLLFPVYKSVYLFDDGERCLLVVTRKKVFFVLRRKKNRKFYLWNDYMTGFVINLL